MFFGILLFADEIALEKFGAVSVPAAEIFGTTGTTNKKAPDKKCRGLDWKYFFSRTRGPRSKARL
jgi:hypothetical protein